jgi:chromosomal replication initiator protein
MKINLPPELIIRTVANYFHIDIEEVKSSSKKLLETKARHISMFFCKEYTELSLSGIGKHFKGRNGDYKDHSTVLFAINRVKEQVEIYKRFRDTVNKIDDLLKKENEKQIQNEFELETVFGENDYFLN